MSITTTGLIFAVFLPVVLSDCSCGGANFTIPLQFMSQYLSNPKDDDSGATCSLHCTYIIAYTGADQNQKRLAANFINFAASTNHEECLTFYDGAGTKGAILFRTCVNGTAEAIVSYSSWMTIVLTTTTLTQPSTPAYFLLSVSVVRQDSPQTTTQLTTTDPEVLNHCTQAFYNNFNAGQMPYSNETVFKMALGQYLNVQGVDGWRNIQTWFNTLVTCVGGQQVYANVFNWTALMSAWNIDPYNAQQWNVRFLTLEYDCGPGFQVLLREFYCIQGVALHEGPVIEECQANFTLEIIHHPDKFCQAASDYLTCIELPYIQHCGRAAAGLVCHEDRISSHVFNPNCDSVTQQRCQGAPGKK